jgi:hypothetical protein
MAARPLPQAAFSHIHPPPPRERGRMTGVMTCDAGEIDVRSFHLLERGRETDAFVLHDEGAVRMSQGMVGTLTAVSHNIHGLKAQSFAQVIDIFTPPYDEGRINSTHWFRLDPFPVRGTGDVFVAHPLANGASAPLH